MKCVTCDDKKDIRRIQVRLGHDRLAHRQQVACAAKERLGDFLTNQGRGFSSAIVEKIQGRFGYSDPRASVIQSCLVTNPRHQPCLWLVLWCARMVRSLSIPPERMR